MMNTEEQKVPGWIWAAVIVFPLALILISWPRNAKSDPSRTPPASPSRVATKSKPLPAWTKPDHWPRDWKEYNLMKRQHGRITPSMRAFEVALPITKTVEVLTVHTRAKPLKVKLPAGSKLEVRIPREYSYPHGKAGTWRSLVVQGGKGMTVETPLGRLYHLGDYQVKYRLSGTVFMFRGHEAGHEMWLWLVPYQN